MILTVLFVGCKTESGERLARYSAVKRISLGLIGSDNERIEDKDVLLRSVIEQEIVDDDMKNDIYNSIKEGGFTVTWSSKTEFVVTWLTMGCKFTSDESGLTKQIPN